MAMRAFVFYPFGECYFFSMVTIGDEVFFSNNNLAPTCSEGGGFQAISKIYITKNLNSISLTYFGHHNLATNCPKKNHDMYTWKAIM
jgi:hypothetical protein